MLKDFELFFYRKDFMENQSSVEELAGELTQLSMVIQSKRFQM